MVFVTSIKKKIIFENSLYEKKTYEQVISWKTTFIRLFKIYLSCSKQYYNA
jgi:hypothetical protein